MFGKISFAALVGVLAATATSAATDADLEAFVAFKVKYAKSYPSIREEVKRFKVFVSNMRIAEQNAAKNPLARFGVNEFSDKTPAEFKVYHNADKFFAEGKSAYDRLDVEPVRMGVAGTRKIDWRTKGAVTRVKNQGQCGSCWAFSTTGGIEGQWFLAGNPLVSLSEQELTSCDTIDSGCDGGLMTNAMQWLLQAHNGTIVTEASYPYVSGEGQVPKCDMKHKKFGATIESYRKIEHKESTMADFVYTSGPLSIGVDASSFQTYTGGILTNCQSVQVDHGVLIAGMDLTNTPPYWIVKNSWGKSWGEEGYIRIEYGTDQCLITSQPCTSKVKSSGPTPAPSGSTFTQKRCRDPTCSDCHQRTMEQHRCIDKEHGSFRGECATDALIMYEYPERHCNGTASVVSNPINQCSIVFGTNHEFIMNECGAGPGPTPPTPPTSPPTPPPAPSTFTQMLCTDSTCVQGCANHTFALDKCLPLTSGGSAKAECSPTALVLTEYPFSGDCSGQSVPDSMPLNKCLQDTSGSYLENFCSNTGADFSAAAIHKSKV